MKRSLFLVMFLLALCHSVSAAIINVSFEAVVNYSQDGLGLPTVGTVVSGEVRFSDDPVDYITDTDGVTYTAYIYSSPYSIFLDLKTLQISSNDFAVSVDNDTTVFGPTPVDAMEFGVRQDTIGYLAALIGPADSFSDTSIPTPEEISSFWENGFFNVNSNLLEPLLMSDITKVEVSTVPLPASIWFLLSGLLGIGAFTNLSTLRQSLFRL